VGGEKTMNGDENAMTLINKKVAVEKQSDKERNKRRQRKNNKWLRKSKGRSMETSSITPPS
jgi:hypothetical protein